MARKHNLRSYKMFNASDITSAPTSQVTSVKSIDKAYIDVQWSGSSPVADIIVEASNDGLVVDDVNKVWNTVDFGSTISISGNTGDHKLIFTELPFEDLRLRISFTSGTGTITATITGKSIGA